MKDEEITRQEALKKMGKYAAFVALGTMIMLTPKSCTGSLSEWCTATEITEQGLTVVTEVEASLEGENKF